MFCVRFDEKLLGEQLVTLIENSYEAHFDGELNINLGAPGKLDPRGLRSAHKSFQIDFRV